MYTYINKQVCVIILYYIILYYIILYYIILYYIILYYIILYYIILYYIILYYIILYYIILYYIILYYIYTYYIIHIYIYLYCIMYIFCYIIYTCECILYTDTESGRKVCRSILIEFRNHPFATSVTQRKISEASTRLSPFGVVLNHGQNLSGFCANSCPHRKATCSSSTASQRNPYSTTQPSVKHEADSAEFCPM